MRLEDDHLRDSIQRVVRLATEVLAPQQTTWSLYGALDAAQRHITRTTDENPNPRVYDQRIRRCIQEAHQITRTGVMTQGRPSKTTSWMELTEARHAQKNFDHIQESDDPPPTECEEAALILMLTLHSSTWNHTFTLQDKTGPPYLPTATCRPGTASAGKVHLDWTPAQGNQEYTVAHTIRKHTNGGGGPGTYGNTAF